MCEWDERIFTRRYQESRGDYCTSLGTKVHESKFQDIIHRYKPPLMTHNISYTPNSRQVIIKH